MWTKKSVLIFALFLFAKQLCAQFTEQEKFQIDSINKVINSKTSHDTSKAAAYIVLSELVGSSNMDTLIHICNKAQKIAELNLSKNVNKLEEKSYKLSLAAALNNKGYGYMNKSKFTIALDYFFKANDVELSNNNRKGLASAYNNIGLIYYDLGDIPLALEYYEKSLKIKEEFNDKKGMAYSFNNIGYVYDKNGDKKLAVDYYRKSLKLHEEVGSKKGMAQTYTNIGGVYFSEKNYSKALSYYKLSLKTRLEIDDKKGIANCYHNLAKVYKAENSLELALLYYQKSLAIRIEVEDKQGEAFSYLELGELTLNQQKVLKAKSYATKGLKIAAEGGFAELIEKNSELLSKIAIKEGNWKEAFEMHNKALQIHDSVASEEAFKSTANLQAKYTYEKAKKIADLEQAKKDVVVKQEKLNQRIIILATAAVLILVLIFLFILFKRFKVIQKQNGIIQAQKGLIEVKHQEISDSIHYAERIQRTFLATKELLNENLKDYFVYFKPKDVVSGDFYWATKLNNGLFALVTADSTGHGVPGAIMSLLNVTSLEKAVEQEIDSSQIFNITRNIIINRLKKDGSDEGGKDGMDASICIYDFNKMQLTITAAHNPVWIVRASTPLSPQEIIEIKPDKMPLGKHDKQDISFSKQIIDLVKGDVIYTLTDGYPDQFGGKNEKKYLTKNLRQLLASNAHLPMQEQKELLDKTFLNWKGNLEQVDDVCVIGVRV